MRRDPVKLYDATLWLDDLPDGDAGLADSLIHDAVRQLLEILLKIDESKGMEELDIDYKVCCVGIDAYVLFFPRLYARYP